MLCKVDPLLFNALVRFTILVAADWLLLVTVLFVVVIELANDELLVLTVLVRFDIDVAAELLLVVTVPCNVVILL